MAILQSITSPSFKIGVTVFIVSSQISVTLNHNYGFRPRVWIIDSDGDLIETDVNYSSITQINVVFGAPFTGRILIG